MRKAKVALARKLAVVLHRMLADGDNLHGQHSGLAAAVARLNNRRQQQVRAGSAPASPGAKSRRRDDGSGQAAKRGAAFSTTAHQRLVGLVLIRPHRAAAPAPTADRSKSSAAGLAYEGLI